MARSGFLCSIILKKKTQEKNLKAYNSESLIVRKQGSSEVLSFYTNLFLHRQIN